MNSAHPLPPSFFSRLSLLRPQVYAHEEETSVVWHFGAPGHGKGVWDGLGGVLKNYIRQVQRSYISYMERMEESGDEESDDGESGDGGDGELALESPIKTTKGSPLRLGRLAGEGRGDVARHPQFHLLLGGRQ